MIDRSKNPDFVNSFLDYSVTILNKSPNSIKEYNYDLMMFFRFMMIHFKLTDCEYFLQPVWEHCLCLLSPMLPEDKLPAAFAQ